MGVIETREFGTELLIGGPIVSAVKPVGAATYHRGQLLGRVSATGVYNPFNSVGSDGTQHIRAVSAKSVTLAAPGDLSVFVTGSQLMKSGIVAADGTVLNVTKAIIENAQDNGIVIKEV